MNPNQLRIENYSDKSYAVFGPTKDWQEELKSLGGRFSQLKNGGPGWIFSKAKVNINHLQQLVQEANTGVIKPKNPAPPTQQYQGTFAQPQQYQGTFAQPQVSFQQQAIPQQSTKVINGLTYQEVKYTLPEPFIGQKVSVNYAGKDFDYNVSEVKKSGDFSFIESFSIQSGNFPPVKVIVSNGKWQMDVPNVEAHTFRFFPAEISVPQIPQVNFPPQQTSFQVPAQTSFQVPVQTSFQVPAFNPPAQTTFQAPTFQPPQQTTFQAPVFQPPQQTTFQATQLPPFTPPAQTTFQAPVFQPPQQTTFQATQLPPFTPPAQTTFQATQLPPFNPPAQTAFQPSSPQVSQLPPLNAFQPTTNLQTSQLPPFIPPAQTSFPPSSPKTSSFPPPPQSIQQPSEETRPPGSYLAPVPVLFPV